MKKILFALLIFLCLTSCDQSITRTMGGTTKIELDSGEKLVEVTWKGDDIWYLVEPMDSNYVPKTKTFSQVAWCGDNRIEIITIRNDKVYNDYFMTFSPVTVESMMDNKIFVNNYSRWYIGYIKD